MGCPTNTGTVHPDETDGSAVQSLGLLVSTKVIVLGNYSTGPHVIADVGGLDSRSHPPTYFQSGLFDWLEYASCAPRLHPTSRLRK